MGRFKTALWTALVACASAPSIPAAAVPTLGTSRAVVASCASAPPARAIVVAQDPKLAKALEAWLRTYQRGKLDVASNLDVGKSSISRKHGVLPKGTLGRLTPLRELEAMLEELAEHDTPDSALLAVQFAAVGLDRGKYAPDALPHLVREAGQRALARMSSDAAHDALVAIAKDGHRDLPRGQEIAVRAAASRALGRFRRDADRPSLVERLADPEPEVRAGAADALGAFASPDLLGPLAAALERERDGSAILALVGAVDATWATAGGAPAESRERAVQAAIAALGRSVWRVDELIVGFLDRSRSKLAIPALIAVLRRFVDEAPRVVSGELSGLLRHAAHQALVSLTGAAFGERDPDAWSGWWATAEPTFVVPEKPAADTAAKTTSGFFGIPVHGTRVVFIVDLSLSMTAPMGYPNERGESQTRLDAARGEVWRAIERFDEATFFNVVVFSNGARAWQKKLVPANEANKKSVRSFLDRLKGEPYTDLWSGIQAGLNLEKNSFASSEPPAIDTMFLLSDGAPTTGELTEMPEILRVVTELNRYLLIRINTVFLEGQGSNMDPVARGEEMGPAELMEQLANQNGGIFVKK